MPNMKPMLFNTEMVRALLENRKTGTRRVVKPQPKGRLVPELFTRYWPGYFGEENTQRIVKPPYFFGDILYVRETWAYISDWTNVDPEVGLPDGYIYKADWEEGTDHPKWRPSIHMPRDAARLFLRVTDVRAERLQDMNDDDARDEGVSAEIISKDPFEAIPSLEKFVSVWNSTLRPADRARYGWAANPWVWVIAFERISKEEAEQDDKS